MTDKINPSTKRQHTYLAKKRETHRDFKIWVELDDLADVEHYALKNNWISETGRNAGKPNLQKTIDEIFKVGLEQVRKDAE